jgi:hypothetical protein
MKKEQKIITRKKIILSFTPDKNIDIRHFPICPYSYQKGPKEYDLPHLLKEIKVIAVYVRIV